MIRILIPLITLGCFCVLASYAQGRYEPGHHTRHAKAVHLIRDFAWKDRRSALIAEVWNVTPQELDKPVNLWGER